MHGRDEVQITAAAAAGLAVGQDHNMLARGVVALELALGFFQRRQQKRAPRRLEAIEAIVDVVADLAQVFQRHHHERLLIKAEHPQEVGIFQVAGHGSGPGYRIEQLILPPHAPGLVDHQHHGRVGLFFLRRQQRDREGLFYRCTFVSTQP